MHWHDQTFGWFYCLLFTIKLFLEIFPDGFTAITQDTPSEVFAKYKQRLTLCVHHALQRRSVAYLYVYLIWGSAHGGTWSNHTYVALALSSLLATCVEFWSHRCRDIVNTAVMFSPERMYITLDSSTCTSYPSLKRYKCIWRFGKATDLHELSSFSLSQ